MKNLNANNRHYLIVMYQHWFIDYNKCTMVGGGDRKTPTLKLKVVSRIPLLCHFTPVSYFSITFSAHGWAFYLVPIKLPIY